MNITELRNDYLRESRSVMLRYRGTGMLSLLSEGEVLIVEKLEPRAIRYGDVLVYQSGSRMLVNRFLKRLNMGGTANEVVLVKGDNRRRARPAVLGAYTGRVVKVRGANSEISLQTREMILLSKVIAFSSAAEGMIWRIFFQSRSSHPGANRTFTARLFAIILRRMRKPLGAGEV